MKVCCVCKKEKSVSLFWKNKSRKDGLQAICISCLKRRSGTEESKTYHLSVTKRYYKTQKGKAAAKRSAATQRLKFPEKVKACNAVNHAIRDGRLERSIFCEECGLPAKTQGHHEDYTNKPLDVDWLCTKCHTKLHERLILV